MVVEDLVGEFSIIGSNQDEKNSEYKGTLSITIDKHKRVHARWIIGKEQEQTGYGFFNDNILVINFQYLDENHIACTGTAAYRCITKDILDGFWSEEFGDPNFLGSERCFRVKDEAIN
ncbi:hypothetical protein [Tenacibaculum jejuense]|uniref:Uncharacterized protein n=1 Tax=Tenacibaculum jejuense TaxID=584609 RepID=A0A238UCT3_9FLAO|nr:hypothetical protein [Tenacibaculum jejuense]SNR17027.1 conserved protein of unknown function [Tenacibaculum jejuense]